MFDSPATSSGRPSLAIRLENSVSTRAMEEYGNRGRTCSRPEITNKPGNGDGEYSKV